MTEQDQCERIRVTLAKDWDTPISPPHLENNGRFAGREKEVAAISSFLNRRDSSTVLITGHRGVGKTSLVRTILRDLINSKTKEKTILPVYITGPQIVKEDNKLDNTTEDFLRIVSTRLFNAIQMKDVSNNLGKDDIEAIEINYKKSVAKDYSHIQESRDNDRWKTRENRELILKFTIPDLGKMLISGGVGISAFLSTLGSTELTPYAKETLAAFVLIVPLLIATFSRSSKQTTERVTEASLSASQRYSFDNSVANLEFDLERIHESLHKKNIKLVYILDELDKVSSTAVTQIISEFKNFFTLGYANYLFVADDEYSSKLPVLGARKREEDYTLFNVHFHISRPLIGEIESYLKKVIDKTDLQNSDITQDDIINYLIFESKSDYFDLILILQNHIDTYENGFPVIEFKEIESQEIVAKSKLHQAVRMIFEEKYHSSKKTNWHQNSQVLFSLYKFATDTKSNSTSQLTDHDEEFSQLDYTAVRDLGVLYNRLNYLAHSGSKEKSAFSKSISVISYQRTNDFSIDVPKTLDFLSQWEEEFVSEFSEATYILVRVAKIINHISQETVLPENFNEFTSDSEDIVPKGTKVGLNLQRYVECKSVYLDLVKSAPKTFKNEFIEAMSNDLKSDMARLDNTIQDVLARSFVKSVEPIKPNNSQFRFDANNKKSRSHQFSDLDNNFATRLKNQRNCLVNDHSNSKTIIFVNPVNPDVFKGINRIGKEKVCDRYKCVSVVDTGNGLIEHLSYKDGSDLEKFFRWINDAKNWYVQEQK